VVITKSQTAILGEPPAPLTFAQLEAAIAELEQVAPADAELRFVGRQLTATWATES
jgi:hypothetical protein